MAIGYLCLVHYHEYDYFFKSEHGDEKMINRDKNTITVPEREVCRVYGILSITHNAPPMIYSWKFEISGTYFSIGICNENETRRGDVFQLDSDGDIYCQELDYRRYSDKIKKGDIVQMEINIYKKQIRYFINDEDQGLAFENIDFTAKTYNMEVCIDGYDEGQASAKLINFSTMIDKTN